MALTKCSECGHEVSTAAAACPNCGAPIKPLAATPPGPLPSASLPPAPPTASLSQSPPPPPPPIAGGGQLPAQGRGVFYRLKSYFLGLPTIVKIGWICLLIGILFIAKYETAFWGVIVALVLGVVAIVQKRQKDGLILCAAALLTFVAILVVAVGNEAVSKKSLTHKQELVSELKTSFRVSLLNDKTKVLVIRNPNRESVDFYLRCHALDGSSRTLFVTAPALDTSEIGIIQGWVFVSGEQFEAVCDDAVIWRGQVPE